MRIVALYFDAGIGRMLRQVLELEGHVVVATRDGDEAVRAIEEEAGLSLLLMDNFHVGPAAHEAFSQLAVAPTVRGRVRVIGLAGWNNPGESAELIDDFIELPFAVEALLEAIEANVARGWDG